VNGDVETGLAATQAALAAHLRDPARPAPAGMAERGLAVYRELVYNNLEGLLRAGFPVLHRVLPPERWASLVRDFLREHASRSPYFLAVGEEFLAYLAVRPPAPWEPAWLSELAHYEWVELALDIREGEAPAPPPTGLDPLDAVPALSPLAWVLRYRWPVHRIGPGHQPTAPPGEPCCLLVYRDREERVRFMELTPATARLLETVQEIPGRPGGRLLDDLAAELSLAPAVLREHGRGQLAEFAALGVLALARDGGDGDVVPSRPPA